jgi:hypothetical protein
LQVYALKRWKVSESVSSRASNPMWYHLLSDDVPPPSPRVAAVSSWIA